MGGTVFEILPVWKRCLYFHASMFGWILETIFPQNVGGISFCLLVSSDAFEKPDDAIPFTLLFSSLDDGPWCGVFFVNWISTLWALSTCRVISLIFFVLFFLELLLYGSWTF